jgi:hypothetical protein
MQKLILTVVFLLGIHPMLAQKRVALVIGVKNYQHVNPLQNSLNDAMDMSAHLKTKDFEVVELFDPKTKRQMQDAVVNYFNLLQNDKNSVGMVYYSGHGMQVDGTNYLIPTQANPQIKADLDDQCLSMDYIMRAIEQAGNELNIFVLDACRNNPFRGFYRSNEQGLSMVATPKGSYIVYATKPGSVASDGTGRNGLFTSKLLKYLDAGGLNIEQVFKKVAADVAKESNDVQRPWIASDYTGDFYFTKGTTTQQQQAITSAPVTQPNTQYKEPEQKTVQQEYTTNNNPMESGANARFITPMTHSVQTQWIKREDFTMTMTLGEGMNQMPVGTIRISIQPTGRTLVVTHQLQITSFGATSLWSDSTVADIQTLAPRSFAASNDLRDVRLTYNGNSVTGLYYDKMTLAQSPINDPLGNEYFDQSMSPYVLSWLPLRDGYQTQIPIYAINTVMDRGVKMMTITSTRTINYQTRSAQVQVYEVQVLDDNTQITTTYYIGKQDRRIYEMSTFTDNGLMRLLRN